MATASPQDRPAAGVAMVVGALFVFSVQDIIIKSFADEYSMLQIVFLRGLVSMIPLLILVNIAFRGRRIVLHKTGWLLLRSILGFASYLCYYMAIAALPLAQVVTITFTSPIFATVLSAILLREPVGWRRWAAVLVGFGAVLIVVSPSGFSIEFGAALALGAALTYSLMVLCTRHVSAHSAPSLMALVTVLVFTLASGLASVYVAWFWGDVVTGDPSLAFLLRDWRMPSSDDLLLIVVLGFIATIGFYYLTKAYCVAPVSVVAPFEYSVIVWAALFGYLIWDEVPALSTWAGLVLLVASSIYILHREVLRSRAPVGSKKRRTTPSTRTTLNPQRVERPIRAIPSR